MQKPDPQTTDPLAEWWQNSVFRRCLVDAGTPASEVERIGNEIKGKVPAMTAEALRQMGFKDVRI